MHRNLHVKGFTLAEVLITLLIIGVISSIVIPGIIADTRQAELKTAWKKAYSDLSQATKRIMMDNGGTMTDCTTVTHGCYFLYKQYLSYNKDCGADAGCFWTNTNPKFNYKQLNGDIIGISGSTSISWFDDGQLILNNGMFLIIENYTGNLLGPFLWIDVNGYQKGPNIIGKDVFGVKVYNNGIKPFGSQGDGYENTCSTSSTGWGCSAKYLYQ
jgi:prepilin-type N-terminal cleavage/methylation domain-containing protein